MANFQLNYFKIQRLIFELSCTVGFPFDKQTRFQGALDEFIQFVRPQEVWSHYNRNRIMAYALCVIETIDFSADIVWTICRIAARYRQS